MIAQAIKMRMAVPLVVSLTTLYQAQRESCGTRDTRGAKRAPAEAELTRSPGTRKSACRYGHMFDEQEVYLEDIIDALRANEGKLFRAVVKKLLNDDSPDSTRVAESLMQHPDLRHLIAH